MKDNFIITIDGPAASGKSTIARMLAARLDAAFLDTGSMYRAVTLAAMRKHADLQNVKALLEVIKTGRFEFTPSPGGMKVCINGVDSTEQIRNPDVTANAKFAAGPGEIRKELVKLQRAFARRYGRIVTEGRDQGTVVFPHADFKFYMTASPQIRAERRAKELAEKGIRVDIDTLQKEIEQRDLSDASRKTGPLKCPKGAIFIDTSGLSIEQVLEELLKRINEGNRKTSSKKKENKKLASVKTVLYKICQWLVYRLCQAAARCALGTFFRVYTVGRQNLPKKGGFLILANHQSFLDPAFIALPINSRCAFVARDTLFKGLFGHYIRLYNAIPISRDRADTAGMKRCIDKLKAGFGLVMFPEGTRTADGRINAAKPGFSMLARRANVPVIPTLIEGAYEVWPRNRKIYTFGRISIIYDKPVAPEEIKKMGERKFGEFLTARLRQMQNEIRIKHGKKPFEY